MSVDPTSARAGADRPKAARRASATRQTPRSGSWSGRRDPCGWRWQSCVVPLSADDEIGHALDAAAPQRLVPVEQAPSHLEPLHVGAHDLAAARALLGDQTGAL